MEKEEKLGKESERNEEQTEEKPSETTEVVEAPKKKSGTKKKTGTASKKANPEEGVNEPGEGVAPPKKKSATKTKKDKVLAAIEELEDDSIDLLFFDPFNRLGDKEVTFKTPEERDVYVKRVQGWLLAVHAKLRNKGGGMVIGVNSFTSTSFGDGIFPTGEVKRMLSWYAEQGHGAATLPADRGYVNTSIPFLWNVKSKPWTFNKPEGVAFFDGEFKTDNGTTRDALDMARQVVRIFSNEGDTVLELFGKGTVIEEAVAAENRKYVSGYVS